MQGVRYEIMAGETHHAGLDQSKRVIGKVLSIGLFKFSLKSGSVGSGRGPGVDMPLVSLR